MLRSLYDIDYADTASDQNPTMGTEPSFHIQVYTVADKYDLPALKKQVIAKFTLLMKDQWTTDEFLGTMSEVYNMPPASDRGLRDVIRQTCRDHLELLLRKPGFRSVLETLGQLAVELLQSGPIDLRQLECTVAQCPYCLEVKTIAVWNDKINLGGGLCMGCDKMIFSWERHVKIMKFL